MSQLATAQSEFEPPYTVEVGGEELLGPVSDALAAISRDLRYLESTKPIKADVPRPSPDQIEIFIYLDLGGVPITEHD